MSQYRSPIKCYNENINRKSLLPWLKLHNKLIFLRWRHVSVEAVHWWLEQHLWTSCIALFSKFVKQNTARFFCGLTDLVSEIFLSVVKTILDCRNAKIAKQLATSERDSNPILLHSESCAFSFDHGTFKHSTNMTKRAAKHISPDETRT